MERRFTRLEKEVQQAMAVMDQSTGKMMNYWQLLRHKDPAIRKAWELSSANEYGRLANGIGGRVKGTNTIKFIRKTDVPADRRRDVTYGSFICNVRNEKKEKN